MKKKISQEFEIAELFLVKPCGSTGRTFTGKIYRETTKDGKLIVRGNAEINQGKIWSASLTEKEFLTNMNELCTLALFHGINSRIGNRIKLAEKDFFLC